MLTHETNAIVKHKEYKEHRVKVQEFFSFLQDDTLTKAVQLQKSLCHTMKFFHRSKPKNDGSRAHTKIRVLYVEDIPSIVIDLRYELNIEEITLGLQRV